MLENTTSVCLSEDIEAVDWVRLSLIFELAPLGKREPQRLQQVFENSGVRCFAFHSGVLIGAGRAITDWVNYAAIFDVVLLPEYQGRGIGRQIMHYLADRSKARNIVLHAVPGKEGFYEKLGYRRMKTAMALFADYERQQQLGYVE